MTILFAVLIGLAVGSFINALVFRTHEDIPITGRSKCVKCEKPIDARDLVPVLSYFLLRGRCRKCKAAFSWQYPAVEAVTGILFGVAAYYVGDVLADGQSVAEFLRLAVFIVFLVIIFVYDLRYSYILDRFTFPAMIIAVLFNLALGIYEPLYMLIGALVLGGFFLAQYVLSKHTWVGGGDIRMGVLMGLMLGLGSGLVALFLSYALGAIVGAYLLISGKKKFGSKIPFGTFLAVGTFVALLWGSTILDWYLGIVW